MKVKQMSFILFVCSQLVVANVLAREMHFHCELKKTINRKYLSGTMNLDIAFDSVGKFNTYRSQLYKSGELISTQSFKNGIWSTITKSRNKYYINWNTSVKNYFKLMDTLSPLISKQRRPSYHNYIVKLFLNSKKHELFIGPDVEFTDDRKLQGKLIFRFSPDNYYPVDKSYSMMNRSSSINEAGNYHSQIYNGYKFVGYIEYKMDSVAYKDRVICKHYHDYVKPLPKLKMGSEFKDKSFQLFIFDRIADGFQSGAIIKLVYDLIADALMKGTDQNVEKLTEILSKSAILDPLFAPLGPIIKQVNVLIQKDKEMTKSKIKLFLGNYVKRQLFLYIRDYPSAKLKELQNTKKIAYILEQMHKIFSNAYFFKVKSVYKRYSKN